MSTILNKRMAKVLAVLAAALLCMGIAFGATGCSSGDSGSSASSSASSDTATSETIQFTDDAGRTVEVPAQIDRIAPSGHTANQVLLTMAPEKMVGLSQELSESQQKYLGSKVDVASLPIFGAVLGAEDDLNREALAAAEPQVIIDTGEMKDGIVEDLDALQEQIGIPVVFIETKLEDYGAAYEKLGELLAMEERGQELSQYCQNAYDEVNAVMANIPEGQRVSVLYLLGEDGTNVIGKDTYQAQVVDMFANNVAVLENASNKGTGSESSLEQIALWNPDVIIFGYGSVYDTVADNPAWEGISAIDNGTYYEAPGTPYNWLNNPPTVNQVMGMQWLPRLLYPDQFDDTIADVTKSYYQTFYGYELSDEECDELIAKAVPKA
ncbi:MAG TPA: ABC transporter substrate-binding protein [Candidatus Aphodovivens avistercoris]|nr:ABC transporter substrate-binding protein [Candidatus Aphodovivens avistercoris]